LSIVIRESVDVDDVLLELLEDRLDDEDESPVVMNKDLPLKFALTSLNLIFELLLDESSFLEQERKVRQKNKISNMCKIFFIFIFIQKSDF
jgi:hypothetical protein